MLKIPKTFIDGLAEQGGTGVVAQAILARLARAAAPAAS